ncbi:MAG TPA: dephospho-CoA kinase [Sediminibacterium sp.]|nr:dephospho-CoA kinase [Sediminibacterium sp.]
MSILKIGLTGGIGSGKSTVASIFAQLDIPVLQADQLAKTIMHKNKQVKQQLIRAFGAEAYLNDRLNSAYIANIVFRDPYQLSVLNSIVHPVTIAESEAWALRQQAPYVIKEAALFFESGSAQGLDGIIGVSAPTPLRIQRVMARDHISREQVLDRMKQQINDDLKMKLCDWVIVNNEQQLLIPQVLALHKQLLSLAGF